MSIVANGKFHFGETWQFIGNARDAFGNPLNLTGAAVNLKLTYPGPGGTTFLSLSAPSSGGSITNAAAGQYLFLISPSQQSGLTVNGLHYTVQIVLSNGEVTTQNTGELTIVSDDFNQV